MPELRSPFAANFTPHDAIRLASVFKALADPTRLRILGLLSAGPTTASAVHQTLGSPRYSTVLKHMTLLCAAGLVISVKRERSFAIDRELDGDALAALMDLLRPAGAR